jgi:hypothetical protein
MPERLGCVAACARGEYAYSVIAIPVSVFDAARRMMQLPGKRSGSV